MKKIKKVLLALALLSMSNPVMALEVTVGGLVYELSGVSAKVVHVAPGNTMATITIPSNIIYEGLNYTVNEIGDKCFVNIDHHYSDGSSKYCDLYENGQKVDVGGQFDYHVFSYCHIIYDAYIWDYLGESNLAKNNSYVKKIILPNSIQIIGKYAFSNSQISQIQVSEGIKQIMKGGFHTPNLSALDLCSTVESIGEKAFYYSKIKEIIIPASVLSMGNDSFLNCSLLRKMVYLGAIPPSNWTATTTTYVPNAEIYSTPAYTINDAHIIGMISFAQNVFNYTGNAPTTTWVNNVVGYTTSLSMPTLKSDAGNYEEVIPTTFTKSDDSFTANIPYRYTINPVLLTAKVNNTSRTYGEANPEFTISYIGFVNGEDENVLTLKPTASTDATQTSAVGTYPITISGGEANNYTFEYVLGELTVKKASLYIQVMDSQKEYGNDNPTFTVGFSGLKNNETIPEWITSPSFTTSANKNSSVGTYPVNVTCEPKNYTIVSNTSGTLTITKAPLSIKANDVSMNYGGPMPTYTFTYTGFKNSDNTSVLTTMPTISTSATTTSNVGIYTINPINAAATNYEMNYSSGTLTIKACALNVKVISASKIYGEPNPVFSLEYSGFVNNETKDVLEAEPTVTTSANNLSCVGTYDVLVSGGQATNYTFTYQNGTLTITPRDLTVSVGNYERPYGQDNPEFILTYNGFAGNDTESSLTTKPIARTTATATSNVGEYSIEVTGGYSPNYVFSYESGKLNIVKAEQDFEWAQDLSNLNVGDQVQLQATASSGLPVTYTMEDNSFAEIYTAGSKTYLDCKAAGTFLIKAVQEGNNNYYPTQRINKQVTIVETSSIGVINTSSINIVPTKNGVIITGTQGGEVIQIYTLNGAMQVSTKAEGSQTEINLVKNKVYVVKIKDEIRKIIL